jgi:CRP-like cAMP-binding protein
MTHAYFPVAGILSSLVILKNGAVAEAAVIGNEGLAGLALLVDEGASPHRVVQQMRGAMLRLTAADFRAALLESAALHELTERYAMALLQQCGQNVACNAHHGVRERMCRWFLATSDRVGADQFDVTQEYLAQMLGVRRQTVGTTSQLLQRSGFISYRRGHLRIHDRGALERWSCECYWATQEAYDRVMQLPRGAGVSTCGG